MSDYASSTSSLVKAPKQLTNWVSHTLWQPQFGVHSAAVSTHQFGKKNNDYYSTLGSSNDQLQHWSPRCPHMTWGPRKCYGKVAYNKQRWAHAFVENNALAPLEKSKDVIFHEPTKLCFRYRHQTMQFSQVICDECNWSFRYVLCQDVILH